MVKKEPGEDDVKKILAYAKADKLVVGHTIVENIQFLYGGDVIAIDLHHQKNFENKFMHALWIEKGKFFVIDQQGKKKTLK